MKRTILLMACSGGDVGDDRSPPERACPGVDGPVLPENELLRHVDHRVPTGDWPQSYDLTYVPEEGTVCVKVTDGLYTFFGVDLAWDLPGGASAACESACFTFQVDAAGKKLMFVDFAAGADDSVDIDYTVDIGDIGD